MDEDLIVKALRDKRAVIHGRITAYEARIEQAKHDLAHVNATLTDADVADPGWRASAVGVYRLWRDLGFAAGALVAGAIADAAGMPAAIWSVAALTGLSGVVVATRMRETHPRT